MEKFFQLLAVVLAGIAAYFLWQRNGDWAFVSAVLGAVSYFLSVRFQVRQRNRQRDAKTARTERELTGKTVGELPDGEPEPAGQSKESLTPSEKR